MFKKIFASGKLSISLSSVGDFLLKGMGYGQRIFIKYFCSWELFKTRSPMKGVLKLGVGGILIAGAGKNDFGG